MFPVVSKCGKCIRISNNLHAHYVSVYYESMLRCLIIFIPCIAIWRLKQRNNALAESASQDPFRESKIHALCLFGCSLTDDRFIGSFRTFELAKMCRGDVIICLFAFLPVGRILPLYCILSTTSSMKKRRKRTKTGNGKF